jgi:pimeloyl-ACP methyl ester carboxylesterase
MGISEAHSVLDSIRAAQRFEGAGTSAQSPSVVWGHSQGGGAALVTAEFATSYAPDASVVGVVAGSPAAELKLFEPVLKNGPSKGYIMMAAAGLKAAYPEIDISKLFTPAGLEGVQLASTSCFEANEKYKTVAGDTLFTADPGATEPFATLLTENSPTFRKSDVPIFMYHGEADELIPVSLSKIVLDKYCKLGTTVSRKTYPGGTHTSVIPLAMADVQQYLSDRLAGKPAPNDCHTP